MPFAELSAGRFHYKDSGGDGPVCVFAHGFLMDHDMFETQVAELDSEYRCIAWDQRYHGLTEAPGDHTYWDSARDELELLDHLGVDRFFHVGMSQGGFIGLRIALTAPDRVRGLVFINSQAGLEAEASLPMYEAMVAQWMAGENQQELADVTAQIIVGPGADAEHWARRFLEGDPARLGIIFRILVDRDDLHDRLPEIISPALVIHGELDAAIPMERAEALARGLPECGPVVVIAGAGHASNLADPLSVNRAVAAFLRANL
jgi:pimeloyl-ACP methyl ester carboxylesterase